MSKIDFVPDEYIQRRESNRANLMYLALLLAVLVGMGMTFSLLKMRQAKVNAEISILDERLFKAQEQIKLLEQLENKGKAMMKTALITAELPDLVSKSVILACLTNNLPDGVALTDIHIRDEDVKAKVEVAASKSKTQFQAANAKSENVAAPVKSIVDTKIELFGIAGDDIEVASYIENLGSSFLIRSVGLIETTKYSAKDVEFRRFKLEVKLVRDVRVTDESIENIRSKSGKVLQVKADISD